MPPTQSCPRRSFFRAAAGLALAVALGAPATSWAINFTDLGELGGGWSSALGVSGNGLIVVGQSVNSSLDFEAFRYEISAVGLGDLGTHFSEATGASFDGSVIVGASFDALGVERPFRFDSASGTMLDAGGTLISGRFNAISADGHVAVGRGTFGSGFYAIKQVDAADPISLGVLPGGSTSQATGVSSDGGVIVGFSDNGVTTRGFKYTTFGGMVSLGVLPGGSAGDESRAYAVSANGTTIVGEVTDPGTSHLRAFKSVAGVMTNLGVLPGGLNSAAFAVNGSGSLVVGRSEVLVGSLIETHAIKYELGAGMTDLGTLGGNWSEARGVSADGSIIVGSSLLADGLTTHAFLYTNSALLDVNDWMSSLNGPNSVLAMANSLASLPMEGAHHRPLMSYDSMGKLGQCWATGDFGASSRNTDSQLASGEVGASWSYGDVMAGLAVGHGVLNQTLPFGSPAVVSGNYLLGEVDFRLADKQSILSIVAMPGSWQSNATRTYRIGSRRPGGLGTVVGIATSSSLGVTSILTESVRLRYDGAPHPVAGRLTATPFASLTWTRAKVDSYQEHGGAFNATFDAQSHTSTEGRLGLTVKYPLTVDLTLLVGGEWIHRFDRTSGALSGIDADLGAMPFAIPGLAPAADQARLGLDVDYKLNAHTLLNFSVHVAGFGERPDISAALSLRRAF